MIGRLAIPKRILIELCALLSLTTGCGTAGTSATDDVQRQFTLLGRLYGQYLSEHHGDPPQDAQEFSAFLQDKSLGAFKIDTPSDLLVSPRDGQSLVVLYGDQVILEGPGGLPWVAYEAQGVDGKQYIIGARGAAEEKTTAEIEQIIAKKPK